MKVKHNQTASGMVVQDGGGLYVHIAFCRRKCIYCDFFSAGELMADWHKYVDALCSEFQNRFDELAWPLRTVYFGGGTPSLMPETEFTRLCSFLKPYMEDVEEFTMEVNPDDVNEHNLELWKSAGVDRLSMGIQTFDDLSLASIGRRHDSKTAIQAFSLARKIFSNISIDLMFGLPRQTLDVWYRDLRMALELRPEHISAYSLMYEEGTALTALRDRGRIFEATEELTEKMFFILIEELSKAGYDHYEISNFSLPGFRSRHNSSYWLQKPYIGLGPSAHSYDGNTIRKANRADLKGYLNHWAPKYKLNPYEEKSQVDIEHLTVVELMDEYLMTRLRMREGIPLSDFRERFGEDSYQSLLNNSKQLSERGVICLSDTNISLSEKAVLLSDSVVLELSRFF
ncbi:MAG: radical SAM family heme chaperone HemW [Muribaculaceae bacterium]|nr:radical SAM family heme chaperone HemW [Muribaculaceae bacterium]